MDNIELLKKILLSEDISKYEDQLFDLIPELKYEKDFDQKSNWHSHDVWNHTLLSIKNCDSNFEDRLILLLHDIGKPFSYQDDGNTRHFEGHTHKSAQMAGSILKRFDVEETKRKQMVKLILNHADKIKVSDINKNNIEYYKRLLKIQMCDGSAYEKEHAFLIQEELKEIEKHINNF